MLLAALSQTGSWFIPRSAYIPGFDLYLVLGMYPGLVPFSVHTTFCGRPGFGPCLFLCHDQSRPVYVFSAKYNFRGYKYCLNKGNFPLFCSSPIFLPYNTN